MRNFGILFREDQEVPGALRRTASHKIKKTPHGGIVLKHPCGLRVHPLPDRFALRLFLRGIFFFSYSGYLMVRLFPVLFSKQFC